MMATGCCLAVFIVFLFVFVSTGFDKVEQSQCALKYYWWTESVETKPIVTPGVTWVGMGNYLIVFPSTNKYVYFRDFSHAMERTEGDVYKSPIRVRTNDGLDIQLELDFSYRLQQNKLWDLYNLVGDEGWQPTLVHVARGVIDNWSTMFSAQDFYGERSKVQDRFQEELTKTLSSHLFIDVQSLLLQPAHFPKPYHEAIIYTQEMKQDIQKALQERKTRIIVKETELNNTRELAKKITVDASGEGEAIQISNDASINQYLYRQQKLAEGYSKAIPFFQAEGPQGGMDSFMAYLKLEALKAHNDSAKMVRMTPFSA